MGHHFITRLVSGVFSLHGNDGIQEVGSFRPRQKNFCLFYLVLRARKENPFGLRGWRLSPVGPCPETPPRVRQHPQSLRGTNRAHSASPEPLKEGSCEGKHSIPRCWGPPAARYKIQIALGETKLPPSFPWAWPLRLAGPGPARPPTLHPGISCSSHKRSSSHLSSARFPPADTLLLFPAVPPAPSARNEREFVMELRNPGERWGIMFGR